MYSKDQIEAGDINPQHLRFVTGHLKREFLHEYVREQSYKFGSLGAAHISNARAEQTEEIGRLLLSNNPVFLRGFWGMGKTSMFGTLASKFFPEHLIYIDAKIYKTDEILPKEGPGRFGYSGVIEFIGNLTEKENGGNHFKISQQIRADIEKSGLSPLEYANSWLEKRGEIALLAIDSVVAFAENTDACQATLAYIASLKNLSHLRIIVSGHPLHYVEEHYQRHFPESDYTWINLSTLNQEQLTKYCEAQLQDSVFSFDRSAIDSIHYLSGGRPWEANLIIEIAFNKLRGTIPDSFIISDDVIEDGLKQYAASQGGALYFANLKMEYQRLKEMALDKPVAMLLLEAANSPDEISASRFTDTDLKYLQDMTLIVQHNDNVHINGELFAVFLRVGKAMEKHFL